MLDERQEGLTHNSICDPIAGGRSTTAQTSQLQHQTGKCKKVYCHEAASRKCFNLCAVAAIPVLPSVVVNLSMPVTTTASLGSDLESDLMLCKETLAIV